MTNSNFSIQVINMLIQEMDEINDLLSKIGQEKQSNPLFNFQFK
jgi:hypothetical protein